MSEATEQTQNRTDEILQEIRIVLPGTQALLGFQFVAFFNNAFKNLSPHLQLYHLVNLLFTTFCTILLITPVALEEISDKGRNRASWLRFTSRVMSLAMFFLLAGLAGDIFVAGYLMDAGSQLVPGIAAAAVFIFGVAMWFGLTIARRRNQ